MRDHHCVILYRCVAAKNRRLFIIFLMIVLVGLLLFLYALELYFTRSCPERDVGCVPFGISFRWMPYESTLYCLEMMAAGWLCVLLEVQLMFVSEETHDGRAQRPDGELTLKQRLFNVISFFFSSTAMNNCDVDDLLNLKY